MKTLIAVPCFDMVNVDFMRCFIDLDKPDGTAYTVIKNSLIYNARNTIATEAIRHGFDRVMWFDSDLVFSPDTLNRLSEDMDKGMDFVSGLYFMRKPDTQPLIFEEIIYDVRDNEAHTGAKVYRDYPKDQVFRIAGAGFGCVMTSVRMLSRLVERYGAPFTPMMGVGEDIAFCYRAQKEGFKLWADSRIKCGHIGTAIYDEGTWLKGGCDGK